MHTPLGDQDQRKSGAGLRQLRSGWKHLIKRRADVCGACAEHAWFAGPTGWGLQGRGKQLQNPALARVNTVAAAATAGRRQQIVAPNSSLPCGWPFRSYRLNKSGNRERLFQGGLTVRLAGAAGDGKHELALAQLAQQVDRRNQKGRGLDGRLGAAQGLVQKHLSNDQLGIEWSCQSDGSLSSPSAATR